MSYVGIQNMAPLWYPGPGESIWAPTPPKNRIIKEGGEYGWKSMFVVAATTFISTIVSVLLHARHIR
jgi:hypothetical protein